MRKATAIFFVSLVCIACQPRSVQTTPALRNDGTLYVYLHAFPREADRLTFRVRSLSAVREDGVSIPLSLNIEDVDGRELGRERWFALGALPPGRFVGLAMHIEAAALVGEEGRSALTMLDDFIHIDVPFVAARKRGVVLSLRLRYAESVVDGFRFAPVFSAEVPGQLATGLTALASCRESNTVVVFDKSSGHVVGVVPTGTQPSGVALAEMRRRAYVAISGEDAVEVIDIVEQAIIDRLELRGGDAPQELALTPDGSILLSANAGSDSVSFIDPEALFEVDRVAVGNGPNSILVDSVGQRAYVFNTLGDAVSILDLPRRAVIGAIRTDSEPLRGQFSPDGRLLYVIHRSSPFMVVVDPATLSTVNRVYVGAGAQALKVDSRTGWIYLARRAGRTVEIYEPDSLLPVGSVPVPGEVVYVTIDGEGNNLFFVLRQDHGIRAVSLAGQRTVSEVDLGDDPYWVTMMGER